ncbi:MAG: adenylyl-sulfate kinase [Polyangiaceae bacterium]
MTGLVVWITGRPSAGKSTFAAALAEALRSQGVAVALLDGDDVRGALRPRPGYDEASRDAFYETLANLAALLARQALIVLVPATAARVDFRRRAKLCAPAYMEVFVDVSLEEARARDAKGLYRALREGRVHGVPGEDVPYDTPLRPDVVARGGRDAEALRESLDRIRGLLTPRGSTEQLGGQ